MPAPDTMTITLAEVQELVRRCDTLTSDRQSTLISAINRFARICSRMAGDIVADPAVIRALIAKAPWQLAGLKKPSWQNICSNLRAALEIAGVAVHRQRRNYKLSDGWEALLRPLNERERRDLRRFAGWCSIYSIAPASVGTDVWLRFLAYLEEQAVQTNPRERAHVARRAWNRSVAVQGAVYEPIEDPVPPAWRAMAWSDFPESLQEEVQAYRARMLEQDPFDEDHRQLKAVTVCNYLTRLRVLLTTLVDAGVPAADFDTLAVVVAPNIVKRGLELRLNGRELDDAMRKDLSSIAVAVLNVARFVGMDEGGRAKLKRLAGKVRFRPTGMCEKNKQRLATLFDPRVRIRLLRLPLDLASELKAVPNPTVRQAQRMQMAVLLEILLHVPMRIRNAAELDLAKDIVPPLAGGAGSWRISIDEDSVKNKVAIDAELDGDTAALLDRHVTKFRPVLTTKAGTGLFVSQTGGVFGASSLSKRLARFIRREIGVDIHAHLFRHLAAHLYLLAHPGQYETVRQLLGHKNVNTTIQFYAGLEAEAAFKSFDKLIDRLRDGTGDPLVENDDDGDFDLGRRDVL